MKKILFIINRIWIYFSAVLIITYFKIANRLTVIGLENIPKKGGVLIASNHVSMFETGIIPASIVLRLPGDKVFAPAKAELFKIPILNKVLLSWGAFPIKRNAAHLKAMKKIIELAKKEKVLVFPEGTRSKTGELGKGNRMLGNIILKAKPVVIPVRVFGAEKIMGHNQSPSPFHKITIKIGSPINLNTLFNTDAKIKELSQKTIDTIMEAISSIH